MKRKLVTTIAVTAWALSTSALALPPAGQLDPTLGGSGITSLGFNLGGDNDDFARVVVSDAQDRLYVIGDVQKGNDTCLGIARFLPNGELDTEHYGNGGQICHGKLAGDSGLFEPSDALIQPNGMLLVAGRNASSFPVICRFDQLGHLDSVGFGAPSTPGCAIFTNISSLNAEPNGAPNGGLGGISVAMHGQWIMAAMTHEGAVGANTELARLSTNGQIVPYGQAQTAAVFAQDLEYFRYYIADILITNDGKVVLTGTADSSKLSGWQFFIAVVDPETGEPDPLFNDGQPLFPQDFHGVPTSVALSADGNIVVAGANNERPAVAVITRAGTYAAEFHGGQPAIYDPCAFYVGECEIYVTGLEALPDGKILLGGYADQGDFKRLFTMRLSSDGTPDPSYGANTLGQQGYVRISGNTPQGATSMLMQRGRPVLAGWRELDDPVGDDFLLARISNGDLFRDSYETQP